MTAEAPILVDVGRGRLPGEIDWWFLTPAHTTRVASEIIADPSLAHRAGMIYIACSWHSERGQVLPDSLLAALAAVLEVENLHIDDAGMVLTDGAVLESHCDAIIRVCEQRAKQRALADERRRRAPEFQPLEPRVALFRMIRHFAATDTPTPEPVLTAMSHLFGLVSARTGRPLPSPEVLARVGLPADVDRLSLFVKAAKLDGAAMIKELSEDNFQELANHLSHNLSDGRWALSCNGLSKQLGVVRSTIRSWRSKSHYRRFAFGTLMPALSDSYWANYRRRHPNPLPLSAK